MSTPLKDCNNGRGAILVIRHPYLICDVKQFVRAGLVEKEVDGRRACILPDPSCLILLDNSVEQRIADYLRDLKATPRSKL